MCFTGEAALEGDLDYSYSMYTKFVCLVKVLVLSTEVIYMQCSDFCIAFLHDKLFFITIKSYGVEN